MTERVIEKTNTTGNVTNETGKVRILLVEDYVLLRKTFLDILREEEDFIVVSDISDYNEAPKVAAELCPDVMMLGIAAHELRKLETIREVKNISPNTRTLLLIMPGHYDIAIAALLVGANGCLAKSTSARQLVQAVRGIATDHVVLSTSIAEELLKHTTWYPTTTISLNAGEKLLSRELDVIKLVALGMANKEISKALELSPCTVKKYLADIYAKLGVRTRTEAVIIGLQSGFLSLDDLGRRKTEVMGWMSF